MPSVPPPAYAHPGPPPERPERPEGAPERPQRPVHGLPGWPAWTAPVALLSAIGVTLIAGFIVVAVITVVSGEVAEDAPGLNLGLTVVQDAALIGAAVVFARMVARPWPRDFGVRGARFWPSVGWGVLLVASFLLLSGLLTLILDVEETSSEDVLQSLGVDESVVALIGAAALVCVVAPLVEEVFFRGFFFTALRSRMSVWWAAALSGLTFGAVHIPNFAGGAALAEGVAGIVSLSFFGFGLCLLYWKTGSLYPCIAVHAVNNVLAFSVAEEMGAGGVALLAGLTTLALLAILWPLHHVRAPRPAVAAGR